MENKTSFDMILVRYGEMTLKKDNYKHFLQKIVENIKFKLREFKDIKFEVQPYRLFIYLNGTDHNLIINKLNKICGLWTYSLCKKVNKNIDEIAIASIKMLEEYIEAHHLGNFTFKVETARSDKNFPLTSLEISKQVSAKVLPSLPGVKVDVHNPDLTLSVDFRFEAAYIYVNSVKGLGGYPAGIQSIGLSMMSGGLDSPVSTFQAIKKGVTVSAIHFFSPPYTSYSALQKVIDLLEVVSEYQANESIKLYVVPFTKVQDRIHECADNTYMVTLMRRAMYKIATKQVNYSHMSCIINGESIGQVASQTLESMFVVNEVTNVPIIRPLATYDKDDIIRISKQIGTYDISIRPYEDCCTVFVPKHPAIKPRLAEVLVEEEKCDYEGLIEEAFENIKIIEIKKGSNIDAYNAFNGKDEDKFEI